MNPCSCKINSFQLEINASGSTGDGDSFRSYQFNYSTNSALKQLTKRQISCVNAFDVAADNSIENCVVSAFTYRGNKLVHPFTPTGLCARCSLYGKIKNYTMTGICIAGPIGNRKTYQLNESESGCWSKFKINQNTETSPYEINNETFPKKGLWINGTKNFSLNIPNLTTQKTSQFCKDNQSNRHEFNLKYGPVDGLVYSLYIVFTSIETGSVGIMNDGNPNFSFGTATITNLTIT